MNSVLVDIRNSFLSKEGSLYKIIAANAVVFLVLVFIKVIFTISSVSDWYLMIQSQIVMPGLFAHFIFKPWTLFTYFFAHIDFFHILFNMMFLYYFGKIICEYIGSHRLTSLYIYGGVVGGLTYLLAYNTIPFFSSNANHTSLLGASGGVYAVVIAAAALVPNYTFFLLIIGPVKIKYIALFYVVLSFAETIGSNPGGNLAHLGGAAIGFLFIRQLQVGNDLGKPIQAFLNLFDAIKFKNSNSNFGKAFSKEHSLNESSRVPSEKEIDEILEKISKIGYEKLSKEEKKKLFFASKNK